MVNNERLLKLADLLWDSENKEVFDQTIRVIANSENVPDDKELWERLKKKVKKKFDVWPSAYGSAFLSKEYKAKGGTWSKKKKSSKAEDSKSEYPMFLGDLQRIEEYSSKVYSFLEEVPEDKVPEWVESKITQARDDISEIYHYLEDYHHLKESKVHSDSGLGKWFKEKWVDISRKDDSGKHPPCGRSGEDKKGGYPKCRPSKKVDSSTPQTSKSMSKKEKESAVSQKRQTERSSKSTGKSRKPNYDNHKKKD